MLSVEAARFSRRDSSVGGLELLLDCQAFADTMRKVAPHAQLESARITYVKYKPGTNCLVGYQLQAQGRSVAAYAKACGPQALDKLTYWQRCEPVAGPLGSGVHYLHGGSIAVCIWPNDAKSRTLRLLADPDRRRKLLTHLLPGRDDLWQGELQTLVYKPERRYVGCLQSAAGPQAAIKIYARPGHEVLRRDSGIQAGWQLRLPELLGRSQRRLAEAFGWIPGRVLSQALAEPNFDPRQMSAVGEALAELHAQPAMSLSTRTHEQMILELNGDAALLATVLPELADRAQRCARCLSDRLIGQQRRTVTHGDFHARQVVLNEQGVVLLDLDRARLAPPATDLASLVAALRREVVRGTLQADRVETAMESFLEGYGQAAPRPTREEFQLFLAAELLRLSTRFFRYWEPDWPQRTESLLEQAEALLAAKHPAGRRTALSAAAGTGACS